MTPGPAAMGRGPRRRIPVIITINSPVGPTPGFHINYYQGALAGDIAVVTYPNRFLFRAVDLAHCIVMKGVFGSMRMYAWIGPDKETHRIFRITPFEMG